MLAHPSPTAQIHLENEIGDALFALVNLARILKVNPEEALRKATNRFAARFMYMERTAATNGHRFVELSSAEKDRLWEQAKAVETQHQQT